MNTDMNKDQEMLDETRVMERLTDETTVIDMEKIRNEKKFKEKFNGFNGVSNTNYC